MDAYVRANLGVARRRADSLERINTAARKLFIERGYHETRPQDISRDAGLGHGTFYLHYEDKRDCFFAFVEDARSEFYAFMRKRVGQCSSIEETITKSLAAMYEYSDANPGLLNAVMADEVLIDVVGSEHQSLLWRWGNDWAQVVREGACDNSIASSFRAEIIGQAIVGALNQCRLEGDRMGIPREIVIANLTRFLSRALAP